MKAVLFSMYDCYGAGAAAYRLHEALCERGIESSLFVGKKTRDHSVALDAPAWEYQLLRKMWENVVNKDTFSALQFGISEQTLENAVRGADIVNVHWVSNFLSLDNIRWLLGQGIPVVITMHDENLYTGGCHYRHGCGQYMHACEHCPQIPGIPGLAAEILASKRGMFPEEAVIVTPSNWLASLASSSQVFSGNRVEVIPNGIDPNVFHPSLREAARKRYGYDESRIVVLFGCQLLKDERKGIRYMIEAMECLKKDSVMKQLDFVCFGGDDADLPPTVRSFGYVEDEHELASLYAMSDMFVLPSLEDNLPNTMLESLMSGTPVIGFSIGGIPDAVIEGKNGMVVLPRDSTALAGAIKTIAATDRSMRSFCREDAKARYSMRSMADHYIELYHSTGRAAAPKGISTGYNIWFRAMQAETEEHHRLESRIAEHALWLENERKYARLYESVYKIISSESKTRPVAVYGLGAWGRHIVDITGEWITYIIDKKEVDSAKYCPPSRLVELRQADAFVLIAVTDDKELIANVDKAGFKHRESYVCINDLWT
jgi:glycosyltransferase involved in cell wall biosynthesis